MHPDKILGLDIATNTIGWAIINTAIFKTGDHGVKMFPGLLPADVNERRRLARQSRRKNDRLTRRILLMLHYRIAELFYNHSKASKVFSVFIQTLLAILFTGSLLMAFLNKKDFQFWFNLSITVLLGWIAIKK